MTVSIHTTSGWALVISPHQSMALPTQPRRQRGKVTAFPPSLCHSLPAHLCLSLKLFFCKCCVSSLCPHQPVTFSLASFLSAPLHVSFPSERETSESHLLVCLSLPPSLSSVCMQTRPHRWSADASWPEWSSGCQFSPKSIQSAHSHLLACDPNFPSKLSLVFFFFPIFTLYFPFKLLLLRSTLAYAALANGIGNVISAGLCY